MKKLFFSLVAMMIAAVSYAQNTLVVTLSHGEDITMYYGRYALRDAMDAAQSGDVINLSGGAFQAVNITKGVTIRGTGIDDNTPTYIIGDFTINISTEDANRLSIEGVRCPGTITMRGSFNNPLFMKSQFSIFKYGDPSVIKNAMFTNCKITGNFLMSYGSNTAQFINSYVSGFNNSYYLAGNTGASFLNCIILPDNEGIRVDYIFRSQLNNCIIYKPVKSNNEYTLPASSIAINCVSIGNRNTFSASSANTNNQLASFEEVFKTFTGSYSESELFELTDEAKTKFQGDDGKEVGWYGGLLPYTSTPSYPQITKMNVANKTTADGKLSVEIEVSAAQ